MVTCGIEYMILLPNTDLLINIYKPLDVFLFFMEKRKPSHYFLFLFQNV